MKERKFFADADDDEESEDDYDDDGNFKCPLST